MKKGLGVKVMTQRIKKQLACAETNKAPKRRRIFFKITLDSKQKSAVLTHKMLHAVNRGTSIRFGRTAKPENNFLLSADVVTCYFSSVCE